MPPWRELLMLLSVKVLVGERLPYVCRPSHLLRPAIEEGPWGVDRPALRPLAMDKGLAEKAPKADAVVHPIPFRLGYV